MAQTRKKKAATKPKAAAKKVEAGRSTQRPASEPATVRVVFIEDTTGEQFECEVPASTLLSRVAGDFFENQGWDTQDSSGRAQRAVVELVDGQNPDKTMRLRSDETVEQAGIQNGDVLRIFPESVAGAISEATRLATLIQDVNGMRELADWNRRITFQAKPENAPIQYIVKLDYPGFARLQAEKPVETTRPHEVEIRLPTDYPRVAPIVYWRTEVFHPNIHPMSGAVSIGAFSGVLKRGV